MIERREIHWTQRSEDHIGRHGVVPDEVRDVLYSRPRYWHRRSDEVVCVFGQTESGRYLLVVLADSADGRWFVVTARDMTATEKSAFRKKGH